MILNKDVPVINLKKTGEKLRKLREERQLSIKELAQKLNISYQAVSSWEEGRKLPFVDIFLYLSKLYSLKMEDFLIVEHLSPFNAKKTASSTTPSYIGKGVPEPSYILSQIEEEVTDYTSIVFCNEKEEEANGTYLFLGNEYNFNNGLLCDAYEYAIDNNCQLTSKITSCAIVSNNGSHREHWWNGIRHCDYEASVIDKNLNIKEYWINGVKVNSLPKK